MIQLRIIAFLAVAAFLHNINSAAVTHKCSKFYSKYGLSKSLYENIVHAIHSITLNELRKINPKAKENNSIPVVNPKLQNFKTGVRILSNAPLELNQYDDFEDEVMNDVDRLLSQMGTKEDRFGPNWSPLDRITHHFHMKDLWSMIRRAYNKKQEKLDPQLCECLMDTKGNGIYDKLNWVADHYFESNLLTVDGQPSPQVTDSKTWADRKHLLLKYYTPSAVRDVVIYLHCMLD